MLKGTFSRYNNRMNDRLAMSLFAIAYLTLLAAVFAVQIKRSQGLLGAFRSIFTAPKQRRLQEETHINVQSWAEMHAMRFRKSGNWNDQAARMEASPEKTFFRADQVMDFEDDGPMASGTIKNRKVWLYSIVGRSRPGSKIVSYRSRNLPPTHDILDVLMNQQSDDVEHIMYMWCLEIHTNPIPLAVAVSRKDINEEDIINTESVAFEQRYNIHNTQDSMILQLLDPAMMHCIMESRVDAIEFSDSSIVLYELNKHISLEVLNAMLEAGLKIAEQVDRNYPLAKYAQKAK